jgi:5'-nucleotidase
MITNKTTAIALLGLALAGCDRVDWREALDDLHDHPGDSCGGGADGAAVRAQAEQRVGWRDDRAPACPSPVAVQLLGINDFHGQLSTGRRVANRPVGGAAVLASYLKAASQGLEDRTVIVHAGDHVGASPPASALLQDEPSISFLNLLGNGYCGYEHRTHPRCNLLGTLGNHEFDEGKAELLRLVHGGQHPQGPFLERHWRGATFPYVSANVVESSSGKPLLAPFVVKQLGPVRVGFIGAVLKETPSIVTPSGVAGLTFQDEAPAINAAVAQLKKQRVRAIVVSIHQGGTQASYNGATTATAGAVSGVIVDIIKKLDDEVDVVVSGHAHAFTNALLNTGSGKPVLVTQAFSSGSAYGDIDLQIDPRSGDVIAKSAAIVTTWGDEGPGLTPDAEVAKLVAAAEAKVAPLVERVVGTASVPLVRTEAPSGESPLGNLIADAQRKAMGTDFAFMNPGGVRADVDAGPVTWGELFAVQPFGNSLVKMSLTGQQIFDLLEQQWLNQPFARILKTSGLTYSWDGARPVGARIVEVKKDGVPLDKAARYTVTVNSFLASGGDNFVVLPMGTDQVGGPVDLDALLDYVSALPQPFGATLEGRITRVD